MVRRPTNKKYFVQPDGIFFEVFTHSFEMIENKIFKGYEVFVVNVSETVSHLEF